MMYGLEKPGCFVSRVPRVVSEIVDPVHPQTPDLIHTLRIQRREARGQQHFRAKPCALLNHTPAEPIEARWAMASDVPVYLLPQPTSAQSLLNVGEFSSQSQFLGGV